MANFTPFRWCIIGVTLSMLAACGGGGSGEKSVGSYKIGKPYQVKGVWYYPAEDFDYRETGIASWYGPGFHGKSTANGERYDQDEMTAAHRTLPMPSIVRVTNLDNGRSVVVRVNDRGPFANNRIIDMSRKGADKLGFIGKGTAKVRVEIMEAESRAIAEQAKRGSSAARTIPASATASVTPDVDTPPASRLQPDEQVQMQPVGGERIYVQAGAFSVYDNAEGLRKKLASLGNATLSPTQSGGQEVYRVRIGPLETVENADRMLEKALDAGFSSARIVIE